MSRPIFAAIVAVVTCAQADAGLVMTIDSYTADAVTITISGTFDADTIGDKPGWMAIKKDWETSPDTNTDWFSGFTAPTISSNTITFDGVAANTTLASNGTGYGDDVAWRPTSTADTAIAAGTVVAGSITLSGTGLFDPADASSLQLVSGYSNAGVQYQRLEFKFSSVPEPSFALFGLVGTAAVVAIRRRRKS